MKRYAVLLTIAVLLIGCEAPAPEAPETIRPAAARSSAPLLVEPTGQDPTAAAVEAPDSRVIVHLFEWRWDDVAAECEAFLGSMGYDAVQVSPPVENSVVEGRPWWERYQPVTYRLDNRSGDRAAFADMVRRCNTAGVEIYVDAVLNHMTGVYSGVGTAGSTFGEYDYPGLYEYDDFHHCGLTEGDDIQDWNDPVQVRTCELVNLADLATGQEDVRNQLAAYLNDLIGLGVTGFRVDAARHMAPADLQAIVDRLDGAAFIYQEVIDPAPPTWSEPYYPMGRVTEFQYSRVVSDVFFNGPLSRLYGAGSIWETTPFLPSEEAFVFVDNHDNQRGHGGGGHIVTHQDGDLYDLTVAFMLAYPYGTARVMASYAFETDRQGPPTVPGTETIDRVHAADGLNCSQGAWVCEHRRQSIAPMVQFRTVTAGTPVAHWWTDTANQIAFARGDRGFIAINRDSAQLLDQTLQTGLAPGTYCNTLDGTVHADGCTGSTITVGADGRATLRVDPMRAVATHAEAQVE